MTGSGSTQAPAIPRAGGFTVEVVALLCAVVTVLAYALWEADVGPHGALAWLSIACAVGGFVVTAGALAAGRVRARVALPALLVDAAVLLAWSAVLVEVGRTT